MGGVLAGEPGGEGDDLGLVLDLARSGLDGEEGGVDLGVDDPAATVRPRGEEGAGLEGPDGGNLAQGGVAPKAVEGGEAHERLAPHGAGALKLPGGFGAAGGPLREAIRGKGRLRRLGRAEARITPAGRMSPELGRAQTPVQTPSQLKAVVSTEMLLVVDRFRNATGRPPANASGPTLQWTVGCSSAARTLPDSMNSRRS